MLWHLAVVHPPNSTARVDAFGRPLMKARMTILAIGVDDLEVAGRVLIQITSRANVKTGGISRSSAFLSK
jgi:hypothetical protein